MATCVGMCGVKSVGSGLDVQAITTYHLLISRTHTQLLSTLPVAFHTHTFIDKDMQGCDTHSDLHFLQAHSISLGFWLLR